MKLNLIAEFCQTNVMSPRAGVNAAALDGACHNFTIHWLSLMARGGGTASADSARRRMSELARQNGASSAILQKVFSSRYETDPETWEQADSMSIFFHRLLEKNIEIGHGPFRQDDIVSNIRNPKYSGSIYSFWFQGSVLGAAGGAHTIGFFRAMTGAANARRPVDNYISAFDPNFGEYRIASVAFDFWLNDLKKTYGIFTHHMQKYVSA